MIIRKHGYVLDVDVEETLKYSKEHTLCTLFISSTTIFPAEQEISNPAHAAKSLSDN